jgi:hypothetical protein
MTSLLALRPGDLCFSDIGGIVPGFFPVGVGHIAMGHPSWPKHVRVVTQQATVAKDGWPMEGPRAVEAMPSGARAIELNEHDHWDRKHVYVRPPYDFITDGAGKAAEEAERLIGTPYSFLDYVALAMSIRRPADRRFGSNIVYSAREAWLRSYIRDSGHMMCSQLGDHCVTFGGVSVFDDGRLHQDVLPSELFVQTQRLRWETFWPTGNLTMEAFRALKS